MNDFDILIGVDMSKVESDVKTSLASISTKYPLKLSLIIDGEDKLFNQAKQIQKLFNYLEKLDINFGLNENLEDVNKFKTILKEITKYDLSNIGDDLTDSLENANKSIEKLNKSFDTLMKQRRKKQDGKEIIDVTEVTGNQFKTVKQKRIEGTDGNIITQEKLPEPVIEKNFAALNKYVEDSKKAIESMTNVNQRFNKEISSLTDRLDLLRKKLEDDDDDFYEEVNQIKLLIDHYSKVDKEIAQNIKLHEENIKITDRYSDSLNKLMQDANKQIVDNEKLNEVLSRTAEIQQRVNSLRERGTEITYKEQRALQEQIALLKDEVKNDYSKESTTQRLTEKFESLKYRSTRGFSDRSLQKQELMQDIAKIEKMFDSLTDHVGRDFQEMVAKIQSSMNDLSKKSMLLRDEDIKSRSSSFGQLATAIKKVPMWASAMSVVYGAASQVRQGFQDILDMDAAMVDLQKVTEASKAELEQFKETAASIGNQLGTTSTQVIQATTSFQRLGYSLKEATILSKNSLLYANVGDMDIETASDNIISTIKGFSVEVDAQGENVRRIVDMFNEVSNNFAVSAQGIGDALKRSSAVMYEAGNTMEETIGLVASANAVIQDPAKVGTALKTVAMRLRGVSEEGEDVSQMIPQLEGMFQNINKELNLMGDNALTLLENDGKTFKSTYEIFESIAQVWDELSDIERANIVEQIGGKQQGVVVAAIINNWKDAKEAAETATKSAGSATREFEAYTQSFAYKIAQLQNSLETFWNHLVDSDMVKMFISGLTGMINTLTKLIDTFGSAPLLSTVFSTGLLLMSKTVQDIVLKTKDVKKEIADATEAAANGFKETSKQAVSVEASVSEATIGVRKFKAVAMSLGTTLMRVIPYTAVMMAVGEGINLIIKAFQADAKARRERIQGIEDEITKLQEANKAYKDIFDDKRENDILDRFSVLQKASTPRTPEEEKEYYDIVTKIKDEMPELVSHYDQYGNAVIKSAESIKALRIENNKLLMQQKQNLFDEKMDDTNFKDINKKFRELSDYRDSIEKQKGNEILFNEAKKFIEEDIKEFETSGQEYLDMIESFRLKITEEFNKLPEDQQDGMALMNLMNLLPTSRDKQEAMAQLRSISEIGQKQRELYQKEYEKTKAVVLNDDFSALIEDQFDLFISGKGIEVNSNDFVFMTEMKKAFEENIDQFGNDAEKIIEKLPTYWEEAFNTLKRKGLTVDQIVKIDPKTSEETERAIANLLDSLNVSEENVMLIQVLKALKEAHHQAVIELNAREIKPFNFENVISSLNSMIDSISDLDSAYRTLNEGEELNMDTTLDLISAHPELIKTMKIENGVLKITKESIKEVARERERAFKQNLQNQIQERQESLKTANQIISDNMRIMESIKSRVNVQELLAKTSPMAKKNTVDVNNLSTSMFLPNVEVLNDADAERYKEAQKVVSENEKIKKQIEQEIADMQKLMNARIADNLGSLTGSTKDKKKDLQDAIYVVDLFQRKMDLLNREIEKQQNLQSQYTSWSEKYKKSINDEIYYTNEKKKAIDAQIASLQKQIAANKIAQTGLIQLSNDDDNKTARAKAAEIQQKVDEARKELLRLQSESDEVAKRIQELRWTQVESITDSYNNQREMLSDDIAYQEYAMSLYQETTQAYRDHANEKLALLRQQQEYNKKELAFYEKEKTENKNLTQFQIDQLNQLIREKRSAIYEMAQTIEDIKTIIASSELDQFLEKIASESNKYADKISEIEDKIKYELDNDKDFQQHISYLQEIVSLRKGEQADIENNIAHLKDMLERNKDNKEMVEKISDEIESWEDKLEDAKRGVKDVNKEIKEIYDSMADKYIDLYKEYLEDMKKADEEYFENKRKAQQKAHDDYMDQLDKELKALQDAYDKQMKLLDREEAEHDYQNDVSKAQKEIDDLKQQIDALSMDDSFEAKKKKAALVKQLTEKELALAELQHDRTVQLRKDNLEDDFEAEKEKLEARKEANDEETQNLIDSLQEQAEARQKYWEDELNNEKKFAELRKQVLDGHFDTMLDNLNDWSASVSSRMSDLGQTIEENFTWKIKEAVDEFQRLKNSGIGSYGSIVDSSSPTNLDGTNKPIANLPSRDNELNPNDNVERSSKIQQMKENSEKWRAATTKAEKDALYAANQKLGKELNAYYDPAEGRWYTDKTKKMQLFDTGGYTGDWAGNEGKVAILHKKEQVFEADDTQNILDAAIILRQINSLIRRPSISPVVPNITSQQATSAVTQEQNEYNIEVIVQGNADKKVADTVADQIVSKLKRTRGGRY